MRPPSQTPAAAYQRGYTRGYERGRRNAWPDYAPPSPPEPMVHEMASALKRLAEAAHDVLSVIEPDEPIFKNLQAARDHADAVMGMLSEWLKKLQICAQPENGE